ncbi:AMP-binding protein [Kangiella aquimarina]|uniref:AMP-binding protein n=1 Tax=Kangiella aquimarina TaxID=261965 RepID=A0ABZ0X553_9GAMM|nr:AMP-binding protein [Kangiella aquimarina]WQG85693.1 AMP-binding protein [Kangiella aquimarina]
MEALDKLNQLIQTNDDHCVAYDKQQQYPATRFREDLARAVHNIQQHPHQRYLLFIDHSYNFAVNLIALFLLQKDVVLTANSKADWLSQISDQFDAVIGDATLEPLLAGAHFLTSELEPADIELAVTIPLQLDNNLTFFTSGSTSQPKAISKSIQQLLTEVSCINSIFGSSVSNCTFLSTVSHHHIYGLIFRLLWPLLYRYPFYAEIVLYQEQLRSLSQPLSQICLISSPAFLSRQDHELDAIELKQCFSSGSLLSEAAAQASYEQLGIFPVEVFGSTETGGIGYRTQSKNQACWTLFPSMSMQQDAEGITTLSSPYLSTPYRLDDDIQLLPGGQFRILGRLDRVVKIEEKRVSLDAIETTLIESSLVNAAKVVVLQHHRTYLGAVIVLSETGCQLLNSRGKHHINQCLRSELAERYEAVAIPRKWRYLEQLPYNSQGKLTLDQLMGLF